jgi:hypothetical protein
MFTLGVEQFLFNGKIKWHVGCDNGINCGLDSNTVCEGKSKGDEATVDDIVGTNGKEEFHELSSRVELERLREGVPRFVVKHDRSRDLILDSTRTVSQ